MSDHWEFFPCQMGEDRASIFYDHGIYEEIDDLPLSSLFKVRVAFKVPRVDGMPTDHEFDALMALEDALSAEVGEIGGVYVGRISVGGHRYFYYYVDAEQKDLAQLVGRVEQESAYDLGYLVDVDRDKKGYWEDLFPTKADWQVIKDQRVLSVMQENGDDLETPRRIDHWAYFPRPDQRDAFKDWVEAEGFSIERADASDEKFAVQFFHTFSPAFPGISNCTIKLMEKAEACGGDYDGWETSVERGEAIQPD